MAYIALLTVIVLFVLGRGVRAEETAATLRTATLVQEEQSDFELLTPISKVEVAQIRGENGLAPYSVILASAIAAARAYRAFYAQGCIGTISRNANGTFFLTLPPSCTT